MTKRTVRAQIRKLEELGEEVSNLESRREQGRAEPFSPACILHVKVIGELRRRLSPHGGTNHLVHCLQAAYQTLDSVELDLEKHRNQEGFDPDFAAQWETTSSLVADSLASLQDVLNEVAKLLE